MDQAHHLRALMQETQESPARFSRMVAVASGKGGVGKSTLTLNLGIALSKLGKRVAILDLDFGFGNLETLLGANATHSIADVKAGTVTIEQAMIHGPHGLRVLAGGSGFTEMFQWRPQELSHFFDAMDELEASFDWIFLDTGAGLTEVQLAFLKAVKDTLIVTTPEPTALTDAYSIIKLLHHHEPQFPCRVVINQITSLTEGKQTAHQFRKVCKEFLKRDLPVLGFVYKDNDISQAIKLQTPYLMYAPRSQTSRSIERLAHQLLGEPVHQTTGISGFFKKWMTMN